MQDTNIIYSGPPVRRLRDTHSFLEGCFLDTITKAIIISGIPELIGTGDAREGKTDAGGTDGSLCLSCRL
jgi:hypothetical protein